MRTTDQNGLFVNKLFNILVRNVAEPLAAGTSAKVLAKTAPVEGAALAEALVAGTRKHRLDNLDAVFTDWGNLI